MNQTQKYYYEMAGDIPAEYDFLEVLRDESWRLRSGIAAFVDGMIDGKDSAMPIAYTGPQPVFQCDAKYFAKTYYEEIRKANKSIEDWNAGKKETLLRALREEWKILEKREADYLAYNVRALDKRKRLGREQAEINRVQGLIDEGRAKLGRLRKCLEWLDAHHG